MKKAFSKDGYMYIVMGAVDFEIGDTPLALLWTKRDARAFQDACYEHKGREPQFSDHIASTPGSDEYEVWRRLHDQWLKKHPAGPTNTKYDTYNTVRVSKYHVIKVLPK